MGGTGFIDWKNFVKRVENSVKYSKVHADIHSIYENKC